MELGNLLFGNSRGEFPINRGGVWENAFGILWEALSQHHQKKTRLLCSGFDAEFENDIFKVTPYYWGDCTCGFEELEIKWSEENDHEEHCYVSRVEREVKAHDQRIDYKRLGEGPMVLSLDKIGPPIDAERRRSKREHQTWLRLNKLHSEFEDQVRRRLCQEMGLSYPDGCAVHCTCSHDERWNRFLKENDHKPECPTVQPNFLYKPTNLQVQWYKYPFRDAYSSQPTEDLDLVAIVLNCLQSLK